MMMTATSCGGCCTTVWVLLSIFTCSWIKSCHSGLLMLGENMFESLPRLTVSDAQVFKGNISHPDHFHQIQFEENYFLIGARNVIYNISLNSLKEYKDRRINWFSSDQDVQLCLLRQKTPEECQNYVRVIAKTNAEDYLICGTNSFKPLCRTYRCNKKKWMVLTEESGTARCPFDPSHNSTSLYVGQRLYSGTVADLSARDALIYSLPLRTEQHDSQWLNDPNFVSSFAHDSRAYFFFRETAVENINCGKAVFSRVARVCMNDAGGSRVLRNTWTSFNKARLNCSIPGEFPFYFDEIQSTSDLRNGSIYPTLILSDRTLMVYAVFATPRNSIRGSAVCAFRFADIVSSFEGSYKEQKSAYSNWLPVRDSDIPDPHPAKFCPNETHTVSDQTLNFIKSHPLMDRAVPAFGGQPIFVQTSFDFTFTHIAVDWQVETADQRYYDILYIGTDDGRVIKVFNRARTREIQTVVIEVLTIFTSGLPVTGLKIYRSPKHHHERRLLVMSRDEIRSVPLHRCGLKTTCSSCIAMRDPYCSWKENKCMNSNYGMQSLETGQHAKCASFDQAEDTKTVTTTTVTTTPEMQTSSSSCGVTKNCNCPEVQSTVQVIPTSHEVIQTVKTSSPTPDVLLVPRPVEISKDVKDPQCPVVEDASSSSVSMAVVLTVVFSVIVSIIVGVIIGYFIGRYNQLHSQRHLLVDDRTLRSNKMQNPYDAVDPYKLIGSGGGSSGGDRRRSQASEKPLNNDIYVNELKENNSKMSNSVTESSFRSSKTNTDYL